MPILALLAISACYSSSYRKGIEANVTLISDLADKLADYCRSDFMLDRRPVSSEEMGEFYYALKKARSFAAMNEALGDRPSYQKFRELLDAYQSFVRAADQYRLSGKPDPQTLEALMGREREVKRQAQVVLEAVG
ncbi:MAG TPA: hypothetical protein VMB26_05570, partial [Candidatus Binataceae bacterium]|nr:hypothetical protein [Candidatus Binataceae bacterium]